MKRSTVHGEIKSTVWAYLAPPAFSDPRARPMQEPPSPAQVRRRKFLALMKKLLVLPDRAGSVRKEAIMGVCQRGRWAMTCGLIPLAAM